MGTIDVKISLIPTYNLQDVRFSVSDEEFKKAWNIFESGNIENIVSDYRGFSSSVLGTSLYKVGVGKRDFKKGFCSCYLGERNYLCKHRVALAIAVVYKYKPNETEFINTPLEQAVCSGEVRDISEQELKKLKSEVSKGLKFIKNYPGPSKIWFKYQDDISTGSRLIIYAFSKAPVCKKSALVCISLIKKLDHRLSHDSIDDSDGTVGGLVEQLVELLGMYIESDSSLKDYIVKHYPKQTNFDFYPRF